MKFRITGVVVIRPETCVAIRPELCVVIRPITRKIFVREQLLYDQSLENCVNFVQKLKFGVFAEKNFFKTRFLQKVIFADLTFIGPITPKFRGGNDFYKTNHSKIHELRPITPKSDWSYNHPPLYRNNMELSGYVDMADTNIF